MFGALKRGFRSMAILILVRNVVGELRPKRTLAASRGFLASARLSCNHLKTRKNARLCTNAPNLKKSGRGTAPSQYSLPSAPAALMSTLSYTLFSPFRRL